MLVTLGGRYDWADQGPLLVKPRMLATDRYISVMIKQFTWRGGVNYLFDNGVTPYFSYSQSFEPSALRVCGSNPQRFL